MNLKLTKKAIEEKDKLTAGEISSINFSKMALGSGLYTSEELANEITELSTVKITTDIADVYQEMVDIKTDVPKIAEETVKKESQFFITSTFFNKDVEEKFEVREVGIYAISNNDEQEYLYAYYIVASTDIAISIMQDKSLPQYTPVSINTKLSNIDQVNITVINDILVVHEDEFKRYKVDIKKHIDDEDISIRTYVEEQDTDIRNTKADLIHGHNLTDENITGILPITKGGTGKDNGDAEFNNLKVKSLLINNKPISRACGMPSYATSATQLFSATGYTNRGFSIPEDAWYRFNVKGGGVSSHSTVMPYGFFIRYLVAGTYCYIGVGGRGSGYGGGGSTTLKINNEVFDMPGNGSMGGGGSAGGGGYHRGNGGNGGYGGSGGTSSSLGGKPGGIGFPFGSGGGDGLDSSSGSAGGGGAGGGLSGGSSAAGTGGGLYGGNFLSDIFSAGSGGIGGFGVGAGGISGGGFGGHFPAGMSMNVDFLGYTPGNTDGYCRIYKINW